MQLMLMLSHPRGMVLLADGGWGGSFPPFAFVWSEMALNLSLGAFNMAYKAGVIPRD
jgi:hypothetical protein